MNGTDDDTSMDGWSTHAKDVQFPLLDGEETWDQDWETFKESTHIESIRMHGNSEPMAGSIAVPKLRAGMMMLLRTNRTKVRMHEFWMPVGSLLRSLQDKDHPHVGLTRNMLLGFAYGDTEKGGNKPNFGVHVVMCKKGFYQGYIKAMTNNSITPSGEPIN